MAASLPFSPPLPFLPLAGSVGVGVGAPPSAPPQYARNVCYAIGIRLVWQGWRRPSLPPPVSPRHFPSSPHHYTSSPHSSLTLRS